MGRLDLRAVVFLACAASLAPGCAPRQYRVARVHGLPYIFPPGQKVNPAPLREQRIVLRGAGSGSRGGACRFAGEGFAVEAAERTVVTTRLDRVVEQAYNQQRMRDAVDEFRVGLEKLESDGCLKPGAAERVLALVGERAPMLATETVFLRYGFNRWRNYIDLRPGMSLGVQWAFSRGPEPWGTNLKNMDIGIRQYGVRARRAASGVMLVRGEESVTNGGPPQERLPELENGKGPHYRLFFLTKFLTIMGEPERSATLIGARTVEELREYTPKFLEDADATCRGKLTGTMPECTSVDKKISLLPEISITANGRAEYVTIGTELRGYLSSKRALDMPFRLERRYGAEYRPVVVPANDAGAQTVPLLDGDRVTYTPAPQQPPVRLAGPGGAQKVPF